MTELTILYGPVTTRYRIKNLIRKYILKRSCWGGHSTLTESLITGLDRIGFNSYNYQPLKKRDIARSVHVLAGVDTLAFAIKLKKMGKIDFLSVGPNIEFAGTEKWLADPAIDFCVKHSRWEITEQLKRTPELKKKIGLWGVGIDLERMFSIREKTHKKKVIIYQKRISDVFCHWIEHIVCSYGYETQIIKYGAYTKEEYFNALDNSIFMVTLDLWETQGIFLTEAWAKNVPTICFDMEYIWRVEYQCEGQATSCPYLTDQTGIRWKNIDELKDILEHYDDRKKQFAPRKWVEENMTIEIAARQFLELLNIKYSEVLEEHSN